MTALSTLSPALSGGAARPVPLGIRVTALLAAGGTDRCPRLFVATKAFAPPPRRRDCNRPIPSARSVLTGLPSFHATEHFGVRDTVTRLSGGLRVATARAGLSDARHVLSRTVGSARSSDRRYRHDMASNRGADRDERASAVPPQEPSEGEGLTIEMLDLPREECCALACVAQLRAAGREHGREGPCAASGQLPVRRAVAVGGVPNRGRLGVPRPGCGQPRPHSRSTASRSTHVPVGA